MVHQAYNFALDENNRLTGAVPFTAATTVEVAATVASFDLGQVAPGFNINTSSTQPHARFAVVLDWGAIDTTITGRYLARVELADTADFATGRTVQVYHDFGSAAQTGRQFATPADGRTVIYTDNVSFGSSGTSSGVVYQTKRFVRLRFIAFYSAGSANWQIQNGWIVPLS